MYNSRMQEWDAQPALVRGRVQKEADRLVSLGWRFRATSSGEREILDPSTGVWNSDAEAITQVELRRSRQRRIGSRQDATHMNADDV